MKTFIFGAGASIPFFKPALNTDYLTQQVCDKTEWDNIIRTYINSGTDRKMSLTSDIVCDVIKRIVKRDPDVNFEKVVEIIDKISSYGIGRLCNKTILANLIYVMDDESSNRLIGKYGGEWTNIPFLAREIIAESIIKKQENEKSPDYAKLSALQYDLFASVCRQDAQVSIMSLNYDDCIYDSLQGLGFETGFSILDSVYNLQFDVASFMNADKVVYFPHGNLKFQFVNKGDVSFWHNSKEADEKRWNNPYTVFSTPGKFAYNFNTFISTGQTKEDGFNYMPYSAYYQRFAIDVFKSDNLYIIGYSFGDPHINSMLNSFLKLSDRNKIYIVDYLKDIPKTPDAFGGILEKILEVFKPGWESGKDPIDGQLKLFSDSIEKRGFGEIYNRVYFYKKGYQEFLEKDQDFIVDSKGPVYDMSEVIEHEYLFKNEH